MNRKDKEQGRSVFGWGGNCNPIYLFSCTINAHSLVWHARGATYHCFCFCCLPRKSLCKWDFRVYAPGNFSLLIQLFATKWSAGSGLTFLPRWVGRAGLVWLWRVGPFESPHHCLNYSLFRLPNPSRLSAMYKWDFRVHSLLGHYSWESGGNHGRIILLHPQRDSWAREGSH